MRPLILISALIMTALANAEALFVTAGPGFPNRATLVFDDFEYTVNRNDNDKTAFLSYGGVNSPDYNWKDVKSEPAAAGGAHGYLYTAADPPGTGCDTLPGKASSSVLILESNEGTDNNQTDFYLQIGDVSTTEWIPPNVWFQFWWCLIDDGGSYASNYGGSKFLYPCYDARGSCAEHSWLLLTGTFWCSQGSVGGGTANIIYFNLLKTNWAAATNHIDCPADPVGNLYEKNNYVPSTNTWTLVKIHIDTRVDDEVTNNIFEIWKRPYGDQTWTKTADFIPVGGTEQYVYTIRSGYGGGHSNLLMPTTSGSITPPQDFGDWWMAMDDFVMAESEAGLPTYKD